MRKKIISFALILVITLCLFTGTASAAATRVATPTSSTVFVNGIPVAFDAYNIGGNNYFKLRDLAYTLYYTMKEFSVGWSSTKNTITITSRGIYNADGSEMASKSTQNKIATPTDSKIIVDGREVSFTAYKIDNNNYFMLRDIGKALDFYVGWNKARNAIDILTGYGYYEELDSSPNDLSSVPDLWFGTWYSTTWLSDGGHTINFKQNNNRVTGTYSSENDSGRIAGTFSATVDRAYIRRIKNGSNVAYDYFFVMAADRASIAEYYVIRDDENHPIERDQVRTFIRYKPAS